MTRNPASMRKPLAMGNAAGLRKDRIAGVLAAFLLPFVPTCRAPAAGEPNVRPPAVAGSFYPGEEAALRSQVKTLLQLARKGPEKTPVALISPHAGYAYSGQAAAYGYRTLSGRTYERAIVLGPSHRGFFRGASLPAESAYRTPLGSIPIDRQAVAALEKESLFGHQPLAEEKEHSIEVQLPFLQEVLGPFRLVPILIGELRDDDAETLGRAIAPLADAKTILVASSDFTHYGDNYDYHPFPAGDDVPDKIRELDFGAIRKIVAGDRPGFVAYCGETGATICGRSPIAILLEILKARGKPAGARLLAYYRSGDVVQDYASSVSYASIGFFDGLPAPDGPLREGDLFETDAPLSRAEKAYLIDLARRAIERAVSEPERRSFDDILDPDRIPDRIKARAGAFVTLKEKGELRGCIGSILPSWPLWRTVAVRGIHAALSDTRFSPVKRAELGEIEIEISVLTPPTKIPGPEGFIPGEHGIILRKGGRSAVYLPQVATEQGWDRETTLSHLARKAGLPSDAWREGATFEVFRAQVFSEHDLRDLKGAQGESPGEGGSDAGGAQSE
ncbi:MAG: AmmeMemoRadiSam system protein B [Planctomycetes bacterium]|nr:AmmeMemoRadiSam system protein B [Planctomycetota bacterium]